MQSPWIEIEARPEVLVLERSEITQVAAKTDVFTEEAHHADACLEAERVVRPRQLDKPFRLAVRAQQAKSARHERPDAGTVRSPDRDPENGVAKQRDAVGMVELVI